MASVAEPPAIVALDDARREIGAALGELRELGEELESFTEQSTDEFEAFRTTLLGRDEQLQAYFEQVAHRERELDALDVSEETTARQLVHLEESLASVRDELSQQRERGEGLEAELSKAQRTAAQWEEALHQAAEESQPVVEANSEQQTLLLSELESLRHRASQLEEELEEARHAAELPASVPRTGQEAHLSGLVEQLSALLERGTQAVPAQPPPPTTPADGASVVVGSLKDQFARLQMQAARRREST